MTILGLVRHGVTDWNALGKVQGQTDIPLNEEGRRQAEALARRLSGEPWDYIISSDLGRAAETADIIAGVMPNAQRMVDARLRERSYGEMEGTTHAERLGKWGPNWKKKQFELGVERDEDVLDRARESLADLLQQYEGRRLLIVSHGGTLRQLFYHLIDVLTEDPIHNTSFSMFRRTDDGWACDLFNCSAHLE